MPGSFPVAAEADECDVVELRAAGGVVADGREDRLADGRNARRGFGQHAPQPVQPEGVGLPVEGVDDSVGVEHDRVAGLEQMRAGLVDRVQPRRPAACQRQRRSSPRPGRQRGG